MRTDIERFIPKIRDYFVTQPINKAWLFGSYSRGEETENSDIDILVEYSKDEKVSLYLISKILVTLSKILNKKVDLVEDGQLMDFAVNSVNHDKILIYERKN
ncbi:MAG: nucleotidyltransferase domain-containing protein [Bacteroidales bacterium]|nr:nucleotidyltransferase domain-containing protein [Bacteroidales bacterium]